jgi:hypothetical protein
MKMKFNINVKEPYKTAIIIAITTTTALGVAYLVMPKKWQNTVHDFVTDKFKKKEKIE